MEAVVKKSPPRIFDYTDYRLFLNDYYLYQKESTHYFSYRYFSQKAGFSSHNVLKLVITGQRNIDIDSIEKFSSAFKLKVRESEYFRLLVLFGQSKKDAEKKEIFQKMTKFIHRSKVGRLTELQYKLYTDWYHCAIREYISCHGFRDDFAHIARMLSPPIKPQQAKESIALLEEIGLIRYREDVGWQLTEPTLKTEDEVISLSVRQFNRQMIQLADRALDTFVRENREISSMTFAVTKPTYYRLKRMIQEFKNDLLAEIESDQSKPDEVYQLNFQLFPLLQPTKTPVNPDV